MAGKNSAPSLTLTYYSLCDIINTDIKENLILVGQLPSRQDKIGSEQL